MNLIILSIVVLLLASCKKSDAIAEYSCGKIDSCCVCFTVQKGVKMDTTAIDTLCAVDSKFIAQYVYARTYDSGYFWQYADCNTTIYTQQ